MTGAPLRAVALRNAPAGAVAWESPGFSNIFILYRPTPKKYVSGESFIVEGRNLRLKVQTGPKKGIYSDGIFLFLTVPDIDDYEQKRRLVVSYMKKQCRVIFEDVLQQLYPVFQKYGVTYPALRIRNMESSWGSCLPQKGIITLNQRLLEAPRNCIEYVAMHEYCHFIHPNHSKEFYTLLTMLMPDWKDRKAVLERCASYHL